MAASFDSRFIIKNTSGSTNGSATRIAAIDMSTWSGADGGYRGRENVCQIRRAAAG
jgi:hypothetical protein